MSRVEVKPITAPSALYVAENLRVADRQELETASGGLSPTEALFRAWAWSELAWVAYVDGKPAVVFGVCNGGVIWLVGTDDISRAAKAIFKLSKVAIGELLTIYPRLYNKADCRNRLHLRWLRLLGFTMGGLENVSGLPFQHFYMNRKEDSPCASPQQSSLE